MRHWDDEFVWEVRMRSEVTSAWAKRFIGNGDAFAFQRALERENYWTSEVLDLMITRCDELNFQDPPEGLRCAQTAVLLADRVRDIDKERKALVKAALGSAYRCNGLYVEARHCYEESLELASSRQVCGGILQRVAVLEWAEQKINIAIKTVDASFDLLDGHDLGVSFVIRGSLHAVSGELSRSVEDQGKALLLLRKDSHSYFCAIRNLGDSLFALHDLEAIAEVLRLVAKARAHTKDLTRRKRKAPAALLDWLEGRILGRLGSHRQGISRLSKARRSFFELGGDYARDAILVAIDLAIVYEAAGENEAAATEAATSLQIAKTAGFNAEAQAIEQYLDSDERELVQLRKGLGRG